MKGMKNDVFISYRRNRGEAWASLLKELLAKKGLIIYLDKHKKHTVDFKEALHRNIEESNNFLLILSEDIFNRQGEEVDWVQEEIVYARAHHKNIIAVTVNGYDPSAVKWSELSAEVAFLETFECIPFVDTNIELRDASVNMIIKYMVDENGKPWHARSAANYNWYDGGITDADRLWMSANYEVCRRIDAQALTKILKHPAIAAKKEINYLSVLSYDVPSLEQRVFSSKNTDIRVNVYGFCHEEDLAAANKAFGEGHFLPSYADEEDIYANVETLLRTNGLQYFDIVEMTLFLKDCVNPEKIMREITRYMNPNGSACFIRDLDDDLVMAYPDPADLIGRMVKYLSLDPGAGNRHFGKKIYNFFKKSGAEEVHMIDSAVTTANVNSRQQRKICDAYFSYLVPEFEVLVRTNPNNEEYVDALAWLEQHYESDVLSLFSSDEFYFRAGFISGYAIYLDDKFYDDDDM